jgi:hypothetical protein
MIKNQDIYLHTFVHLGFASPGIIIHSNKSNQPDVSISQIYCSSFKYSSTCFGHPHAHHQELINCSSSLRFYRWSVVVAVLLVVVGPIRSDHLCDELITRPEESYRLWFVVACDLETSRMRSL